MSLCCGFLCGRFRILEVHYVLLLLLSVTFTYRQQREPSGPLPGVSTQGSMMQGIKPVVVGDGDIGTCLQQDGQHVIPFLAYGVMQGRVSL